MKIYKRFFDARRQTSRPLHAHVNNHGCWLVEKPNPRVIESASFRAILRNKPSDLVRSFELGQTAEYYSSIIRGIGETDLVNLYVSERQAREHYEQAVSRHNNNSTQWQRQA